MKQVVDASGNKLVGIFKKDDGSIVVINPHEYKKVVKEISMLEEIVDLKERLSQLEHIIQKFITIK